MNFVGGDLHQVRVSVLLFCFCVTVAEMTEYLLLKMSRKVCGKSAT